MIRSSAYLAVGKGACDRFGRGVHISHDCMLRLGTICGRSVPVLFTSPACWVLGNVGGGEAVSLGT